jgi:hypothetical protein
MNSCTDNNRAKRRTLAALLLVGFCGAALAQTPPEPKMRSDIKADTKAAESAHALEPAGENSLPVAKMKSNKTKAQRKAETKQAENAHQLTPAGEESPAIPTLKSTKTKAERKTDTRQAEKNHEIPPLGERDPDSAK